MAEAPVFEKKLLLPSMTYSIDLYTLIRFSSIAIKIGTCLSTLSKIFKFLLVSVNPVIFDNLCNLMHIKDECLVVFLKLSFVFYLKIPLIHLC
jgi:hypothetical protein